MNTKRSTTGRGSIVHTGEKLPRTNESITPEAIAWARDVLACLNVGPVLAAAMLRGGIEVLTDDPARRAALRSAIEASDAALPSTAHSLVFLAAATRGAADTLTEAARASERGDNDAREALIRKAREALRAVLADDTFTLAPEVSK